MELYTNAKLTAYQPLIARALATPNAVERIMAEMNSKVTNPSKELHEYPIPTAYALMALVAGRDLEIIFIRAITATGLSLGEKLPEIMAHLESNLTGESRAKVEAANRLYAAPAPAVVVHHPAPPVAMSVERTVMPVQQPVSPSAMATDKTAPVMIFNQPQSVVTLCPTAPQPAAYLSNVSFMVAPLPAKAVQPLTKTNHYGLNLDCAPLLLVLTWYKIDVREITKSGGLFPYYKEKDELFIDHVNGILVLFKKYESLEEVDVIKAQYLPSLTIVGTRSYLQKDYHPSVAVSYACEDDGVQEISQEWKSGHVNTEDFIVRLTKDRTPEHDKTCMTVAVTSSERPLCEEYCFGLVTHMVANFRALGLSASTPRFIMFEFLGKFDLDKVKINCSLLGLKLGFNPRLVPHGYCSVGSRGDKTWVCCKVTHAQAAQIACMWENSRLAEFSTEFNKVAIRFDTPTHKYAVLPTSL